MASSFGYTELMNNIAAHPGAGTKWSGLNSALDIKKAYDDAVLQYKMNSQLKQQETVGTGISNIYSHAAMTGMPVDPNDVNNMVSAIKSGGIASGNPNLQSPTNQTDQPINSIPDAPGTNPSALAGLNPRIANTVRQIANYQQKLPGNRISLGMKGYVASYDPTFNEAQYGERQTFIQNTWDKGELSKQRLAIENTIQHTVTFQKYMEALNNGDLQLANKIKNDFANQTGNPNPQNAATFARLVGSEVAKTVSNTGVLTDEQRRDNIKSFPEDASPAQAQAAVKNSVKTLQPRINSVLERYHERMGKYPDNGFSPEAINALKSLDAESYNSLAPKLKLNGVQQQPIDYNPLQTTGQDNQTGTQKKDYSSLWSK